MALLHNPSVVTSGLVFAADPANIKSYRENLLTYSENLITGWSSGTTTITNNVITAPNGTSSGSFMAEAADTGQHLSGQSVGVLVSGTTYTLSVYAKAGTRTQLGLTANAEGYSAFNLLTGTVIQTGGNVCTITPVGNGWYRCTAAITKTNTDGTFYLLVWNNTNSYAGIAGYGIYIWGAQVNVGSGAAPYTPTIATAVAKTLNDTSGNSVSGTCTDTTFSVTGGGSLTFNGSTSKISTTAVSGITGNGSWTMSMWANVDASENGAGRQGWLMWNFSSLTTNTLITMGVSGGSIEVAHYSNDFVYTSASVSFGSWSQYTVTYDGTTVSVYVNGIFKQSRSTGPFNIPATGTWFIGTSQAPGGATDFLRFNSGVTQVYNRALSATEVAQNFAAHRSRYGV
jgi:hypothetical protein